MTAIQRFEDLKSWQEARVLAQLVYRLTRQAAFDADRDLRWQMRAAAVSSMSNIAEAHGRYSFEDKRRFLDIALASCKEIQGQCYVALDQQYFTGQEFTEAYGQAETVARLITGSLTNLDRQIAARPPMRARTRTARKSSQ